MTKTDKIRRQELNDKFKDLEGWDIPSVEFRIREKEGDADRVGAKIHLHLDAIWNNTSLLAIPNDKLQIMADKVSDFAAKINAEITRRS